MAEQCKNCGAVTEGPVCSYCKLTISSYTPTYDHPDSQQESATSTTMDYNYNQTYLHDEFQVGTKNKTIALILCFFCGLIGIHRFYLGYIKLGILYCLTGGLFGIGWLYDLALLLANRLKDADGFSLAS